MAVIARMVYHCYGWLDHSCWANAQLLWLAGHLKWAHGPQARTCGLPSSPSSHDKGLCNLTSTPVPAVQVAW